MSARHDKDGLRPCPDERLPKTSSLKIDVRRFQELVDGRDVIRRWSKNADHALERAHDESTEPWHRHGRMFEAFIHAWIGFNGWASCVLAEHSDWKLVEVLARDPQLADTFKKLMHDQDDAAQALNTFVSFWPLFQTSDLTRTQAPAAGLENIVPLAWDPESGSRADQIDFYLREVPTAVRAPDCHATHAASREPIPADWYHCLPALYRVRCNLFHGRKSSISAQDRDIVASAARVLVPTVRTVVVDGII